MIITLPIILPLISAVLVFGLGVFVYFKNKKSLLNIIFGLHSLVITVWLFGTFMMFLSKDAEEMAIFWDRFIYIGVVFIPIFLYHFSIVYCNIKTQDKIIVLGYLLSFIFLILSRTDYFVSGLFKYQWGVHTQARLFHHIFLAYFASYVFLWFYNVYQYYRKITSSLAKQQTKYVFLAFLLLFTIGPLAYLPAYGIGIYPFAYVSGLLFTIILAYAILRYRLMDIRVAIKRTTVFSAIVVVITAAYTLAAFLLGWVIFGGVYTFRTQIITGLIVAFLVAIGFRPLYDWIRRTTDTFLFKGEYRPQELMADVSDVLSRTLDLDTVIDTLKKQISRALRIENMRVIILEEDSAPWRGYSSKEKRDALRQIIAYFKKQRETVVLEEIKRKQAEKVKFEKSFLLIAELEKLKMALMVPLFLKEKLVGLFLLSFKKSGDMFTNEDIKTLEGIASQAAIAIENARLYEKMKDFSKTLQKEVKRQTKNLKEANIRLRQLDKAKSEFVSLASHQLRTPLTAIKGYISMLLEGTWGNLKEEQKKPLKKVYLSNERLIKLVEDLLTVSRIESGRLKFDFRPLDLDKLVESMVKELNQIAKSKGLYLKYIKPKKPFPKVKADSLKIRQVIQNLIENSILYTEKGGATIRFQAEKDKVIFSVEDTGIGISLQDQAVLFEKFSRGKGMAKIYTEGTGLGLYLAAKLVKAHHGRIWVKSAGKNKGSTFYVELPVG